MVAAVSLYFTLPLSGADCADTGEAEDCAWWNEQGYCTSDEYKDAMIESCAATCGCGKDNHSIS